MTEATTTAAPPQGLPARAVGMFTSPRATYERLVPTPKVGGMLMLVAVLLGLGQGGPLFTERGRALQAARQAEAAEQWLGRPMSAEELQRAQPGSQYMGYIVTVSTAVFTPLMLIVFAGVFYVVFNVVLGGTATFKQLMAVVAHSWLISAVGELAAVPLKVMQEHLPVGGPFALGVLFPMLEPGSFLKTILDAVNLFGLWGMVVTAIGLGVLYRRSSRNIAITLFAIYGVMLSVYAAFFSR